MKNKFKAFLFALVVLSPGCSKRIHDSIKLDINSNESISAKFKINKSIHFRMKYPPCRDRVFLIAYPVMHLNEYSYGHHKDKYLDLAIYEPKDKSGNYLPEYIDWHSRIDSIEYRKPSIVVMKILDDLENVQVVKDFNISNKNIGLVFTIYSHKPGLKIKESEITNLIDFMENIEIVGFETYINKCGKRFVFDLSQQSD